ncbi:uncharacterized protein FA14DRAFT_161622 [Meira miltonrushii]|uniref:Uncharacterized protein n=1 Tax=Meira miltonrushii TaxID=1280837 RepID=A0A316VDK5_9BASI|nr:uncharacterized protein FA14DRAFT_161622 [Meira miltonrushii]PWN34081.1 hypothetical protein FA14DRAFT_161622 [Meira miltonrushii]
MYWFSGSAELKLKQLLIDPDHFIGPELNPTLRWGSGDNIEIRWEGAAGEAKTHLLVVDLDNCSFLHSSRPRSILLGNLHRVVQFGFPDESESVHRIREYLTNTLGQSCAPGGKHIMFEALPEQEKIWLDFRRRLMTLNDKLKDISDAHAERIENCFNMLKLKAKTMTACESESSSSTVKTETTQMDFEYI